MCGIIGYVGERSCKDLIFEGLQKLEYRGYDSAGICLLAPQGDVQALHAVGNLSHLEEQVKKLNGIQAHTGLGHTRWATHGVPSARNAHPHNGCNDHVWIVINGIIENYQPLRASLEAEGHTFTSETDSEVLAHLIERYDQGDFMEAVRRSLSDLEGHFAFCAMNNNYPDEVLGGRKEAPLLVGRGQGETFLASAVPAFLAHTRAIQQLEDGEIVRISRTGAEIFSPQGLPVQRELEEVTWSAQAAEKGGYETFMLKEIGEQPAAISDTLTGRFDPEEFVDLSSEIAFSAEMVRSIQRIAIVGCGTSYHAGLVGRYVIERLAGIPVALEIASEFRYREPLFDPHTLVIAISQSGETADTLASLRMAREQGAPVLGITNVLGSQITREADGVLFTRAGLEIGVAATKTHVAQITALLLFALWAGRLRGTEESLLLEVGRELTRMPEVLAAYLELGGGVRGIAERYADNNFFLYLGRHIGLPVCLEGALKLKEISYIPTEAYPAGEMKHGPIALLSEGSPVVVVATDGPTYSKVLSNISEVAARGARIIAVASEGNESIRDYANEVLYVPQTHPLLSPLVAVVPLQLFAYHVARSRGCNMDQPRNLAKTVTVE